ncbi:MAG: HAMP domain-containing histidine kinase [Bacilli bacterium]|nr:HAMP domain-containing histidine kinase [Bacilli bacterium]
MKNKNNKNFIIESIILLFIILIVNFIVNNYYQNKYNKIINQNINSIIVEIKNNYKDIEEEKLINIINSNDSKENNLEKYGIDINKVSSINRLNKEYKNRFYLSNIIIITIFIIYIILFVINMKKRNKLIDEVTKSIERINNKDYSLDILKNSEDELSNLKNELYKITIMLKNEAINKEIEKEAIKEGVTNISHQIKTPLTSISILIDNILEEKDMDPKIREEFLKDIRKTIDDINFLVISLLKLSRFDAGVIKFKKEKINILELVNNVKAKLNILLKDKNINLSIDIDKNNTFYGDYHWQLEAITNIVKNSIEYSNINSNIDIKVIENNFYIKIFIIDYGKGMSKEETKKIFNRFYKGENNDSNSFGIGLSLSKAIIEKDNGFIKVKSDVNKGTTFEIKYMKK